MEMPVSFSPSLLAKLFSSPPPSPTCHSNPLLSCCVFPQVSVEHDSREEKAGVGPRATRGADAYQPNPCLWFRGASFAPRVTRWLPRGHGWVRIQQQSGTGLPRPATGSIPPARIFQGSHLISVRNPSQGDQGVPMWVWGGEGLHNFLRATGWAGGARRFCKRNNRSSSGGIFQSSSRTCRSQSCRRSAAVFHQ